MSTITTRNLAAMKAARRTPKFRFGDGTVEDRGVGLARLAERISEHPRAYGDFEAAMAGEEMIRSKADASTPEQSSASQILTAICE